MPQNKDLDTGAEIDYNIPMSGAGAYARIREGLMLCREEPMQHFAVCSNPKCNYSTTFPGSAALQFALNHPKVAAETLKGIDSVLPKARRCELCGAVLLFFCPRCKKELFTSPEAKYCRSCVKEIKPEAGIEGERRIFNKLFKGSERRRGIDRRLGGRPQEPE